MPSSDAAISVIIPTHNRRSLLRQVLDALSEQVGCQAKFEVIVVADGCVDDTAEMLASYRPPFRLRVLTADGVGPAQARNIAAAEAEGGLLVFLDDDVVPTTRFLAAHHEAHRGGALRVVLGPYPPAPHASRSLFRLRVRAWWTEHFDSIARFGHRFSYRDLLTGNLSMPSQLWHEVGGLDPTFRYAREDLELGLRLMRRGIPFFFAPEALGFHHVHLTMTLQGSFRRALEEGRSDVLIGHKHPEIRSRLKISQLRLRSRRYQRMIDRFLFASRGRADGAARILGGLLGLLERRGLRFAFLRLYSTLNRYWYLRGAAEALGSFGAWREFARPAPRKRECELSIDLKEGLEAAVDRLDRVRPESALFVYGRHEIGRLVKDPGSERIRGDHLRRLLLDRAAKYLEAMAVEDGIAGTTATGSAGIAKGIRAASLFFGHPRTQDIWLEQSAQWRRLHRQMERSSAEIPGRPRP